MRIVVVRRIRTIFLPRQIIRRLAVLSSLVAMDTLTDTLTLVSESGRIKLPSTALVVALDETGHEDFADTNYPVFGLGGVAFLVGDYCATLANPWEALKERHFPNLKGAMHASELRQPTRDQLEALNSFFANMQFFRIAVMASRDFANQSRAPVLQLVCRHLLECVAEISSIVQPTEITIVFENSERLDNQVVRFLQGYRFGNGVLDFEPRISLMPKKVGEPFLEVADFIAHTAGAQIRNRVLGGLRGFNRIRQDFEAMFCKPDRRFNFYRELLAVRHTQAGA